MLIKTTTLPTYFEQNNITTNILRTKQQHCQHNSNKTTTLPTYFEQNNNTTNILRTKQQPYQHTSNKTTTLPTYFEQNNYVNILRIDKHGTHTSK